MIFELFLFLNYFKFYIKAVSFPKRTNQIGNLSNGYKEI